MPLNKSAFHRYLVITSLLQKEDGKVKTIKDFQYAIFDDIGVKVLQSTIEKDLHALRYDDSLRIYAPIKVLKRPWNQTGTGFYLEKEWDFFDALRSNWT
jgi:hypothetical protein